MTISTAHRAAETAGATQATGVPEIDAGLFFSGKDKCGNSTEFARNSLPWGRPMLY